MPLEYLTIICDVPTTILFLIGIRQNLFYAFLFLFWLIFIGEHSIEDGTQRNSLKTYYLHLGVVFNGCLLLFTFNLAERGIQLINPFSSIWMKDDDFNTALLFIILSVTLASLYMVFLIYMFIKVIRNINVKKQALINRNSVCRLHYEEIFNRFEYLTGQTLLYAPIIVLGVILEQVSFHNFFNLTFLIIQTRKGLF